jgi:hypothetical protein
MPHHRLPNWDASNPIWIQEKRSPCSELDSTARFGIASSSSYCVCSDGRGYPCQWSRSLPTVINSNLPHILAPALFVVIVDCSRLSDAGPELRNGLILALEEHLFGSLRELSVRITLHDVIKQSLAFFRLDAQLPVINGDIVQILENQRIALGAAQQQPGKEKAKLLEFLGEQATSGSHEMVTRRTFSCNGFVRRPGGMSRMSEIPSDLNSSAIFFPRGRHDSGYSGCSAEQ